MVRNKKIVVRISPLQDQLIRNKAEALGYKNKTAFARETILKEGLTIEKMIDGIHKVVCKKNKINS